MGNCFEGAAKPAVEKKPLKASKVNASEVAPPPVKEPSAVELQLNQSIGVKPQVVPSKPESTPVAETGNNGIMNLGKGDCLEVYSNSYSKWCPGVIQDVDASSVFVAYQVPGEAKDPTESFINTKGLPIDSPELRTVVDDGAWFAASVEVLDKRTWCRGSITELKDGMATVQYFFPDAPANSPSMRQMPLGDPNLQLPGIQNASLYRQGIGQDLMQVGSNVEVYSNSLKLWCPGLVQEMREEDSIISVAFYYPDMDPSTEAPALKELPMMHPDVRLAMPNPPNPSPVSEAELAAGAAVEVYSESRQFWILAHVKEVKEGLVYVLLRYPDMPPESGLFEKVLPVGHVYIRLPMGDSDGS
jgi:hypothetical protein